MCELDLPQFAIDLLMEPNPHNSLRSSAGLSEKSENEPFEPQMSIHNKSKPKTITKPQKKNKR